MYNRAVTQKATAMYTTMVLSAISLGVPTISRIVHTEASIPAIRASATPPTW